LSACSDLVATGWDTLRVRTSGEQLWHKGSSGITTPAVGTAGRAYLPTFDDSHGRLQAWDQDGSRAWQVDFGEYTAATGPPAIGRGSKDSGDTSTTECTSNDRDHRLWDTVDNIYVSVSDGYLYAIDYKGRIRWKQKIGDSLLGPPVVIRQPDDSEVIVAASDWNLLSAFASDGRPLWQLPLDSPARGSPAVAHDRIYVATEKSLYAIGPSSGAPRVGPLTPAATTEPVPTATLAVTPGRQVQPLEPSATPTLPLGPVRGPTATPTPPPRVLFPR